MWPTRLVSSAMAWLMACMLFAMSRCTVTSCWQNCWIISVCWAWAWRSCQSRPVPGRLGCGRGVLQVAGAGGEGPGGSVSDLGPTVSDWSEEEDERSRTGLARHASSSSDRCRGPRRGGLEGPGASSSSSSWGIETKKAKDYTWEDGGSPGLGSPPKIALASPSAVTRIWHTPTREETPAPQIPAMCRPGSPGEEFEHEQCPGSFLSQEQPQSRVRNPGQETWGPQCQ